MASINRDTFYSIATKIPVLILNFVSSVFLVRLLGVEGRGVYTFMYTNADLAMTILALNLPLALSYFIAKAEIPFEKLMGMSVLVIAFATIIFGILLFGLFFAKSKIIGLILPEGYENLFLATCTFSVFFFSLLENFFQGILRGLKRFDSVNLILIIVRVVYAVVYGMAWYLVSNAIWQLNLPQILLLILTVHGSVVAIYSIFLLKEVPLKLDFSLSYSEHIRPFLNYTFLFYFGTLIYFFNVKADVWFIEYFIGTTGLGWYNIAYVFAAIGNMIVNPIIQVLIPHLTSMDREEGLNRFLFLARVNVVLIVGMYGFFILTASFLVPFLYGEEFTNSVLPARILCFAFLFTSLRNLGSAYNYAYERPKENIRANGIGFLIVIVLDIWWIPIFGIIGAAWASVIAYSASSFYMLRRVAQDAQIDLRLMLIPQKSDLEWVKKQVKDRLLK